MLSHLSLESYRSFNCIRSNFNIRFAPSIMSVLLGGGTGFIGRHLQKMLADKGLKVTVISRKPKPQQLTWKEIERNGIPGGCTAVVNLSGENILNPLRRYSDQAYINDIWKSRVDTTKSLADAIKSAEKPPDVFVSMSGVGYYPPSTTATYTETSPGGTDWLADLSTAWERVSELPSELKTRRVVIRSGVVLGKDGGMIQQIQLIFKLGAGGRLGSGTQFFPWIHVKDMAGIITHAVEHDNVTGVLNGVAPEIVTNAEFTSVYTKALKRPGIMIVPAFYLNMMFGKERAMVMLEGQKVIPERTLSSGYKYFYPTLKSACKELAS